MASVTVERLVTPRGELVLRRESGPAGDHHEIVSNGVFLADTRDGRSERELARAAVLGAPDGARVLIGGLGVGFSLAEALRAPAVGHVTVVEVEPAVVRWHRGPLRPYSAGALDDPRVEMVVADLADFLSTGDSPYDAVCLDVDNGPEWTVTPGNAALYGDHGLDAVGRRLCPGGTLAVWSAGAAPAFEARLRARYPTVDVRRIPVARGEPDVVYVARSRRRRGETCGSTPGPGWSGCG